MGDLWWIVALVIIGGVCVVAGYMILTREETVRHRHFPEPDGRAEPDTLDGRRRAMRAADTPLHRQPYTGNRERVNRYADEDETGAIVPGPDYPAVSGTSTSSYYPGSERDDADPETAQVREDRWYPPTGADDRPTGSHRGDEVDPSTWDRPGLQPGEPRTGVPDLDRLYGSAPVVEPYPGTSTSPSAPEPSPAPSAPDPAPYSPPAPSYDPPSSGGYSSGGYDSGSGSSSGGYDSGGSSSW